MALEAKHLLGDTKETSHIYRIPAWAQDTYFSEDYLAAGVDHGTQSLQLTRVVSERLFVLQESQSQLLLVWYYFDESEQTPFQDYSNREEVNYRIPKQEIVNLQTNPALNEQLALMHDWDSTQTALFHIDQRNSWSRLQITEEMIRKLLTCFQVQPQFVSILMTFGEKTSPVEESFATYFDNVTTLNPFRTMNASGFIDLCGYELGYNLKYVDRHGRERPKDPFVIRETGVYQQFDPRRQGKSTWIFVHASQELKERVQLLISRYNTTIEDLALQLEIHIIILTYCAENWREYIAYLEELHENLSDEGFYSDVGLTDEINGLDPQGSQLERETREVREIYFLSDKLQRLIHLISLNLKVCNKLKQLLRRLSEQWDPVRPGSNMRTRLSGLERKLDSYQFEQEVHIDRMESLLRRCKDISTLVRHLVDFRNTDLNQRINYHLRELAAAGVEENRQMTIMATKGAKDTRLMKLITIITAIFLPATFVATLFGTNFFGFDSDSKSLIAASNIWIYFVIAISITSCILGLWILSRSATLRQSRNRLSDAIRKLVGRGRLYDNEKATTAQYVY